MKVFEFLYNGCIHESAAATHSIHKTRKGAEMALEFNKQRAIKEWEEMYEPEEREQYPFGQHQYWGIRETEILS